MFWTIISTLSVKMYILWGKNRRALFGFQFRGLYSNNFCSKIGFLRNFFCQLISSRSKIRWKKSTKFGLSCPNCFIIDPWIETQRGDTHFFLTRNTFYHFKWKESSKISNCWMFYYDRNRLENSAGAFYQNDFRIWNSL